MKPRQPEQLATSQLNHPARTRAEVALDMALEALVELLVVIDLVDDGDGMVGARGARRLGNVSEARHAAAKLQARQAIQDIDTLRQRSD